MQEFNDVLPDGWNYDNASRLRCPCGNICDEDGQAHCGCESPLLDMGMI